MKDEIVPIGLAFLSLNGSLEFSYDCLENGRHLLLAKRKLIEDLNKWEISSSRHDRSNFVCRKYVEVAKRADFVNKGNYNLKLLT